MDIDGLLNNPPAIMGILNITPDSFSDGGLYLDMEAAMRHAASMYDDGVDIIDVGGESTRPGAEQVETEEEIARVIPVIKAIKKEFDIPVSCDTRKSAVAAEAVKNGADMINDVSGFSDPDMRRTAAEYGVMICIMHMQGIPATMQDSPEYTDVCRQIRDYLYVQARICEEEGIDPGKIIIDPGIGFGKTLEHNLEILANIGYFSKRYPVLVGASRKSFIDKLLGIPVEERLPASLASEIYCVLNGASIIRVHDVKETKEALEVVKALKERDNG